MNEILSQNIDKLTSDYPEIVEFFKGYNIHVHPAELSLNKLLDSYSEEFYEDLGIDKTHLLVNFETFVDQLRLDGKDQGLNVKSLTIIGGKNKLGEPENIELTLKPGSVTSIVGPTGSGKSRLLGDIEWMAQGDTPTGRSILINDAAPQPEWRFSLEFKLVAQLSQNMNFVMDTTVSEFIALHAESRMIRNAETVIDEIIKQANLLAGEPFTGDTPLTALSGGQSRALMIADTAFLSSSPVVLIDEIENAGIDRKKALSLLVKKEKIVLMATHDPILALMASRRLVIKNGGIHKIIDTTDAEKSNLIALEELDNQMLNLRNRLRNGEIID